MTKKQQQQKNNTRIPTQFIPSYKIIHVANFYEYNKTRKIKTGNSIDNKLFILLREVVSLF